MKMMHRAAAAALFSLFLLAGGCRSEPQQPTATEAEEGAIEGLSPEEIQSRAEAMTPEEAERLGIVDTTIHMENLANPDSLVEGGELIRTPPPDR